MSKYLILSILSFLIISCNKNANAQQTEEIVKINNLYVSGNADSLLLALEKIEKIEEKEQLPYNLYLKKIDIFLLLQKIDSAYAEMIEKKGNYKEYDIHLIQGQIEKQYYKNDKYIETWREGISAADEKLNRLGDSHLLMNKLVLVSLVTSKEEALSELKQYCANHEVDSVYISDIISTIEEFNVEKDLLYVKYPQPVFSD